MRVRDVMTPSPVTILPSATLLEAILLMHGHGIHELPVVAEYRLVGILTDRDIKLFLGPEAYLHEEGPLEPSDEALLTVGLVMTREVLTVQPDAGLGHASRLLAEARIGALPVLSPSGELVGILSVTDVLQACADLFDDPADAPASHA